MLYTKFRGNWPVGSKEEDFDRILPYRGVAAILVIFYHIWAWWPSWSCDQHHVIRFSFPESFHTKFGSDRHSSF